MPERAVAVVPATDVTPTQSLRSITTPLLAATAEWLCVAPTARISPRDDVMASAMSASAAGRMIEWGVLVSRPDQFDQMWVLPSDMVRRYAAHVRWNTCRRSCVKNLDPSSI